MFQIAGKVLAESAKTSLADDYEQEMDAQRQKVG